MLLFISPAKNIKPVRLDLPCSLPEYICEAEELLEILLTYNDEDIMNIMKVNAKLAVENQERFRQIRFDDQGTHAICSYNGIQYKYMNQNDWTKEDYMYTNDHLRILSGFYGVLRPLDSIYPYRLEMQTRLQEERIDNLYSYWNTLLMEHLRLACDDGIYINLASKEYSEAILPYLLEDERCVNIHFKIYKNNVYKTQATDAKMARGLMVEYCMRNKINDIDKLKAFQGAGYQYEAAMSDDENFTFIKIK